MGVRPLPQLTRLSQGMRPLRQRTLTPSESRLPRQKEVSQAAQKLKQCSHRGPSPGRVPAVRGGTGYGDIARQWEQGAGHPTHPLTLVNHSCRGSEPGTADTSARPTAPVPAWAAQLGLWAVAVCCGQ